MGCYGHVIRKNDEDSVKKCMDIRVEIRRPSKTWLENLEADMSQLKIDKEDIHDRKNWRKNFVKSNSTPRKTDFNPIIILYLCQI